MTNRNLQRFLKAKLSSLKNNFGPNLKRIKISKKFIVISALTTLAVLGLGKSYHWIFPVWVNGKPISRFQIWSRLEKNSGKQVVEDMINDSILDNAINRAGIKFNQKKVDEEVARMEKQMKNKINHDVLVKQFTRQEIIEELLGNNVAVSSEEMKNYFKENEKILFRGKDFEDVKNDIENTLKQQKLQNAFNVWFAKAKQESRISNSGL